MTHVKNKAVEVLMCDGQVIMVHAPQMKDLPAFFQALPSLSAFSAAMNAVSQAQDGLMGLPVNIPPSVMEGIYPLLSVMADMTVEEFQELPLWDGMAILTAFNAFVPNPVPATAATPVSAT